MAKIVNRAFDEFLANTVRISNSVSDKAKGSRTFLRNEIESLSNNGLFLPLVKGRDCNFGSFARKTKIVDLNDIDMIVALNCSDTQYNDKGDYENIVMTYTGNNGLIKQMCDVSTNIYYPYERIYSLNSTKIKNTLVKSLNTIGQYEKADIHSRKEAVTLKLKSYEWNFDIIPAYFVTNNVGDILFYLIPNGNGNWKKTNPIKEAKRIQSINKEFNGKVYDVVRLVKYWNTRARVKTITSYVLEAMVLDYFDQTTNNKIHPDGTTTDWVDVHFKNFLNYMSTNIYNPIYDPKGIEGNINDLSWFEQNNIADRASSDYEKAKQAIHKEINGDHEGSINIWRDIFGDKFPKYE